MKESDVYVFTDKNQKTDENILSVDFYFESSTTLAEAVHSVDTLVEANTEAIFTGHRPSIYCLSPFATMKEEE
jgi:hypothetical protein